MNAPMQPDAPEWLVERFRSPLRVYVPSIGTVTGVPNDPDELAAVVWAECRKHWGDLIPVAAPDDPDVFLPWLAGLGADDD